MTSLNDGGFVLDGLPEGDYELFSEGYYFEPPVMLSIGPNNVTTGLVLAGHRVSAQEVLPTVQFDPGDADPVLVTDGSGRVHLIWRRGDEFWQSRYDYDPALMSSTWRETVPISGTSGLAPAVAFGAELGGAPGLIAVWEEGIGNEAHLAYAIARPDLRGALTWTAAVTLTRDTHGDSSPVVTVGDDGKPLVVWQQRNWEIDDDQDLYFDTLNAPVAALTSASLRAPRVQAGASPAVTPPGCVGIRLPQQEYIIPDKIPLLGGKHKLEIYGNVCTPLTLTCQIGVGLMLDGKVTIATVNSVTSEIRGSATFQANPETCTYEVNQAIVYPKISVRIETPLRQFYVPQTPLLAWSVGGQITGEVGGSLGWRGGNFPGWPNYGKVDLQLGGGPQS